VSLGQLPSIALAAQDEDFGVVDEPVGHCQVVGAETLH
jgi:hypothetical protein